MAGMRNINAGTRRAALQYYGITPNAGSIIEKAPDLCYRDFLESLSSTGLVTVPLLGHGSANLVTTVQKQLITIPLPAASMIGGYIRANTMSTDGTDMQSFVELIEFAAVNKAGSYTSTVTNLATVGAKAVSAGTLTTTWAVVNGTNAIIIAVTGTPSLTPTSFVCHFEIGFSTGFAAGTYPAFL